MKGASMKGLKEASKDFNKGQSKEASGIKIRREWCEMKKTNLANLRLVMLELVKHEKYKSAVEQKCATLKPEELAAVQKFIA